MATRTTSSYTFEARATVFWSRIRAASTPSTPRAPFHSAVGRSGRFRPAMALFRRVLMASSAMFMQCPVIRILKIPSAQVCSALAVERLRVSLVAARTALSDITDNGARSGFRDGAKSRRAGTRRNWRQWRRREWAWRVRPRIPGVRGESSGGPGVLAEGQTGVYATGNDGAGVQATSKTEQAAILESTRMAQLWVVPLRIEDPTSLPRSTAGELLATVWPDQEQRGVEITSLWFCKIGGDPTQANWVKLA